MIFYRALFVLTLGLALAVSATAIIWGGRSTAPPQETGFAAASFTEDWDNGVLEGAVALLDVPVSHDTQWAIYKACGFDTELFCFLMAVGARETEFNPDAIGDGGDSIGMFQVQPQWHQDRMDRLGADDLTDPAQCAKVAADYILELRDVYGFRGHGLAMAYNMGPTGARGAMERGTLETEYSRDVMGFYEVFRREMGGRK